MYALLGRYYGFNESDVSHLTPRQVRMYMEQIEHVERMMSGEEASPEATDEDIIAEAEKFRLKPPIKR